MPKPPLTADEGGAMPVVGVVLIVGIAVVLAGIIGPIVLQIAADTTEGGTAPQARFDFEYDAASNELTVTHAGGEDVDRSEVEFGDDGDGITVVSDFPDAEITADDEAVIGGVESDTKVWVFWDDPEEDQRLPMASWSREG